MDQAASAVDFIRSSRLYDRKFRTNFWPIPDRRGAILQFSGLTTHRTEKISSHQKIILQGKTKILLSASNNIE
jgi:hypothetical protein